MIAFAMFNSAVIKACALHNLFAAYCLSHTMMRVLFRKVMVIVKVATENRKRVDVIHTNDLQPYKTDTHWNPYITAYFKTDLLPFIFVIGDGKEHTFQEIRYVNQPLKQNTSYIVFLRFFENDEVNSTENLICTET